MADRPMVVDTFEDDDEDELEERPAPVAVAPSKPPTALNRAVERWGWRRMIFTAFGAVLVATFVVLPALGALFGGTDSDPAEMEFPATTTTAPEPPRTVSYTLVAADSERADDDPLKGAPDLHPMVVFFVGSEGNLFVNMVGQWRAQGAQFCSLWFGLTSEDDGVFDLARFDPNHPPTWPKWRVAWSNAFDNAIYPGTETRETPGRPVVFPNVVYSIPVFVGGPCPAWDDPGVVPSMPTFKRGS